MQERDWVAHLDACKAEGVSLKAYARRHGLSVDSLYYQRRKMMLRGVTSAPVTSSKADTTSGLFTRLQIAGRTELAGSVTIRLCLGSQLQLEMPSLPPVEWLAALAQSQGVR